MQDVKIELIENQAIIKLSKKFLLECAKRIENCKSGTVNINKEFNFCDWADEPFECHEAVLECLASIEYYCQ